MLELTVEQISMGQVAVDKSAALHLLADKLVADGLVAEGYLSGLQAREAQGSTFLGQGIAIPHGTPETREQVFSTGVRLLQFPEGVDWGDGQIVYLAIGIAAKSDEHLRLLQLLTRALGETDLGQALRRAGSAEALLKLLQGAPQELALDAQMISLGVSADDFEELVWRGARLLRQADCVSNGFAAVLQQVDALPLGDGLWWLHSEQTVKRPGLAFVTPDKPMRYLGQPLHGLFCLASLGEAHQSLLERLCALLIEGRGQELGRATSSRAVRISQPALSRRIEKLEDALGVKLFERESDYVSNMLASRFGAYGQIRLVNHRDHFGDRPMATRCLPGAAPS